MLEREPKTRFIIIEHFNGTKTITDIFTDIIISEIGKKICTLEQKNDIIELPTGSESCCSGKERKC